MSSDRVTELRDQFRRLGLPDDEAGAAASYEVEFDAPRLATETLLRLCWTRLIDQHGGDGVPSGLPAARRLADAGASFDDLRLLARGVAYETLFALFYLLSDGPEHALEESLGVNGAGFPGWSLVETDAGGEPTGRRLDGLYEELLTADPSGREGSDFLNG